MNKLLLLTSRMLCALAFFMGVSAFSQTAGFNETYIVLSINGGANAYYDLQASTGNPDFQSANLGTFCQGSTTGLRFKGGEHKVWKCGGCDLTSTRLYYRIYNSSSSPSGSFVSNVLPFGSGAGNGCGGADQTWTSTTFNVNLLSGLAPGSYVLEVYSDASVTCSGGTVYASNGGSNYKANFTVSANVTYYRDNDGDGYGNPAVSQTVCTGAPTGYVANNTDCNDNNASVYIANSIYIDADGDNYDNGTFLMCYGATEPNGFSFITNGTDCNDANASVYRSGTLFVDADADGYSVGSQTLCYGASVPNGYSETSAGTDCNDSDANAYQSSILYGDEDGDGFNNGNSEEVCFGATIPNGYTDVDIDIDCDDTVLIYVDADGDGFGSDMYSACDGVLNSDDCDDSDNSVGAGGNVYYADADGDGFGNAAVTQLGCTVPDGYVTNNTDCNDSQLLYADNDGDGFGSDTLVACGGVSNSDDCNDAQLNYADIDTDGFGGDTLLACGGVLNSDDCNDNQLQYADADADGFGGTALVACGVTNSSDCNDNQLQYADADGDGFGGATQVACGVSNNSDCNDNQIQYLDADGDGFGSETQVACGVTNNSDCNDNQLQYADADEDGFGGVTQVACGVSNNSDCNDNQIQYLDADGDGFGSQTQVNCGVTNSSDCDDNQLQYADADEDGFGGAIQVACGVTNNSDCNDNQIQYLDADGDGFGSDTQVNCGVTNSSDCDDNQLQYADADEDGFGSTTQVACGVDNDSDCNDNQILYLDADGDGFGSMTQVACGVESSNDCNDSQLQYNDADGDGFGGDTLVACGLPDSDDCNDNQIQYLDADGDGFGSETQVACGVTNSSDCNDSQIQYLDADGDGFGGSTQVACGVSNNSDCNDNQIQYLDADGDGLGSDTTVACGVANSDDCNDNDSTNATMLTYYADADGDSFGNAAVSVMACSQPDGYVSNSSDCNDSNANVYQNTELYVDFDGDGYNNGSTEIVCYGAVVPFGYTLADGGLDCDDALASVNPAAEEILGNGIDDNCNNQTDEGGPQVFTQLLESQCGTTLASINSLIRAISKQNVTSYRFRITNLSTNQVMTTVRTAPHFHLTSLPSYDYATTYSVEVELQISGNWVGSFGPACNISTPAILDEGGAAAVTPSQCGTTLPSIATLIATTSLNQVTGYRFRVTNTLTNQVQIIDRNLHWFSLTMLGSYTYGTTYSIEVAVKTNGDFTGFGSPCFVSTPDVPTLANCDYVAPNSYIDIPTYSLNRVASYRFEFTNLNDFTQTVIDRPLHWFRFSHVPDYEPGAQYAVRVALMTSGSWSPYGEACLLTAPGGARNGVKGAVEETQPEIEFRAVVYPNPYAESFALDMDTPAEGNVHVKVYDMIGKLIDEREFPVNEIEVQQFGERYPSGVYNIIVTQGEFVKTLRVIKR